MKGFLILTSQRTGSTWFVDILNSHDGVICYSELFLPKSKESRVVGPNDLPQYVDAKKKNINLHEYLLNVYNGRGTNITGFKIMYNQLINNLSIINFCIKNKVSIIHLTRSNVLETIISRELLKKSHVAHIKDASVQQSQKITLKLATLIPRIMFIRLQSFIVNVSLYILPLGYIKVSYEDLVNNDINAWRDISSSLGIANINTLESSLKKVNSNKLSEKVTNFNSVSNLLRKSPFSRYLD
jgi:LPS sulfotransferase NodH